MSVFEALSLVVRSGDTCSGCIHFMTDPDQVECQFGGLAILSSAYASVHGDDGLCLQHNRMINGRCRCDAFETQSVYPASA